MISKYDFIKYLTEKMSYTYDENQNILIDTKGEKFDANVFLEIYRKKTGQSFECLYDEHSSLFNVIKCTECGTVILENYDVENYDNKLRCPICTDYKPYFIYYTKEDIENKEYPKALINMYLDLAKRDEETNKRYIKRGGLYDWEITKRRSIFKNSKYIVDIQLRSYSKMDLHVEFNVWKRNNDGTSTCKHNVKIPLSPKTIIRFIKYKTKLKVTWKGV